MCEIRQPRDLAGLRGSRLERGGGNTESRLRPQRCDTCHPGAGAQGSNQHGYCTQPLPSRRQGLERDLPSLAAEPQLLPGPPGSLVLSANLQVLCGCLPTCSSRSLWGFSGHPSGVVTRPPDNLVGIKHPILRSFTRGTNSGKRTPGGLDKNTRDTFRDHIGLRATFSYVLSAWIPHVGSSLQSGFFGRCDAHGRDSSPHAGDCKRTPPPPPSLQYRPRQGTQGQRQVEAGLWTEKVGIAYN